MHIELPASTPTHGIVCYGGEGTKPEPKKPKPAPEPDDGTGHGGKPADKPKSG